MQINSKQQFLNSLFATAVMLFYVAYICVLIAINK